MKPEDVADRELERHRGELLYSERQMVKRGDHRALARSLLLRTRNRAVVMACFGILVGLGSAFTRDWFRTALGVVLLAWGVRDWVQARRTLAEIQALAAGPERAAS